MNQLQQFHHRAVDLRHAADVPRVGASYCPVGAFPTSGQVGPKWQGQQILAGLRYPRQFHLQIAISASPYQAEPGQSDYLQVAKFLTGRRFAVVFS
ncbi:hypothetical protein [Caproicibacter fermentans]|uniref:hypothetical protein n=1 Tax=Caproicibacter fermentans TaxID=2576756 RepID=UPI001F329FA2|nr:hypothetical protein [Caproicibacter fermentans]